jgi:hypothetical protein
MSNFFYRRLNFFNKRGNPLNFDYIGPTGATELESTFIYLSNSSVTSIGDINVNSFDLEPATLTLYFEDLNGFTIIDWANEVQTFLQQGAEVFLNGRVAGQQQFKGKIFSITPSGSTYIIQFFPGKSEGQRIISNGNKIYFNTTYNFRPGGYYKGNIYFDPVSSGLYENEQIFIVQEFYDQNTSSFNYGLPHTGITGATAGKWRTRWYNNKYGETDVSEIIFTYQIYDDINGGDGQPLIISYPNIVYSVDVDANDTYYGASGGYIQTSSVSSETLSISVALNCGDLNGNIYERKLIVEDITGGTGSAPIKVIEVDFYGEIVGEDPRFDVMLKNIGRAFYPSDSVILRDHDPAEPSPNYLEINDKRKELLVAGEEIFPYAGAYRGLIAAIKFFGYQDLRIKEYWLNLEYRRLQVESPLQKNKQFLDEIKAQQSINGYTQSIQIADVLDNPNSGKYRLTQTYGPDKEGNYVLDISSEESLVPSRTYKKTSLFGLYYDLNKDNGDVDEYGYPVVIDAFKFTQEEVLLKLFALKERLKRDYLPLNARIVDITGEGIYFEVYNTRAWTDVMQRPQIETGIHFDIVPNPDFGFIEDLRNFSIRPSQTSIQTPESYFNSFSSNVTVQGGTGSGVYFTLTGATGPNPSLSVTSGYSYTFTVGTTGFTFYVTTDSTLSTVISPVGLENNGATAGGDPLQWYVNPIQTTPVYYFIAENTSLNGIVNVNPSTLSDLGNIINPLDFAQNYSVSQNDSLLTAINQFYDLKQQGEIVELGDGKYDPPALIDPDTGLVYRTPIGMPVVLEMLVDRWTWDEFNINWSSVNIPAFKTGDRVQIKKIDASISLGISGGQISSAAINGSGLGYATTPTLIITGGGGAGGAVSATVTGTRITSISILSVGSGYTFTPNLSIPSPSGDFGTVTAVSYSTGVYTVLLDSGSTSTFDSTELFATSQDYSLLNWKNIDFSNLVDIEWTVTKSATQPGSPYNFVFRGSVVDFYKLAHFVPFTGEYDVKCGVYDGFNVQSLSILPRAITVAPKIIEIDSWTRYREVEDYLWRTTTRSWEVYQSIWEYPAEGETMGELQKTIPAEILDFATYGNKSQEGQDVYVKVESAAAGATGYISFTQNNYQITDISSFEIISGGQYGFATITTSVAHDLETGYEVRIFGSIDQINGRWNVIVPSGSTTTFKIPLVLQNTWNGILFQSSPNKLYVDTSTISGYPNMYFTGSGVISVSVDGREIGSADAGDSLYRTANAIVSAINSYITYPDYFASCVDPSQDPVTVLISAPSDLGATQNGVPISFTLTGSLSETSSTPNLDFGVNPEDSFVFWSESQTDLPNANLKYWGTKRLTWEIFTNNTWEDAYAHGWYDFEYNNDWLGGYELHNIQPGDYIKLSTGNESFPFPIGATIQPGVSPLTVQNVADQLNASDDRYITDFYYRPIPNESGDLPMDSPPINLVVSNFSVPVPSLPAPVSLLGGSSLLIPIIGVSGPSLTTTTTTTSTSTTSTSTSTTSTSTTSTSTSTSSTSTSTTSTSTSTTSTSTTSTSTSTTSTSTSTSSTSTSTSTTSTTTIAAGTFTVDPGPITGVTITNVNGDPLVFSWYASGIFPPNVTSSPISVAMTGSFPSTSDIEVLYSSTAPGVPIVFTLYKNNGFVGDVTVTPPNTLPTSAIIPNNVNFTSSDSMSIELSEP